MVFYAGLLILGILNPLFKMLIDIVHLKVNLKKQNNYGQNELKNNKHK